MDKAELDRKAAVRVITAARLVADRAIASGVDIPARRVVEPVYTHMGALLADSILQAGLSYRTVVLPRVTAILRDFPDHDRIPKLVELVERGDTASFLGWRHPEKPARFNALVVFLAGKGIGGVADIRECFQEISFLSSLADVRGVGPKTVDYIAGLAGVDTVAVDRHIRAFARTAGVDDADYAFLRAVFCCAADLLSVARRDFDSWVWRTMSSASQAGAPVSG